MTSAASISAHRVKQAELARLLGVSRQAIGDLVKRAVFEVGGDGLIDVELARFALANRVRPSAKTAAGLATPPAATVPPPAANDAEGEPAGGTSYHVAKTLREVAEARIAQLKLAEMKGDLVRIADVRTALSGKAAALREGLMQIPSRLSPVMAAETDQARCHDLLQAELRQVLEQFTQGTL